MKKFLIIAIAALPLFFACKKSFEHSTEYEKSYSTWLSFKKAGNNSYIYTVTTGSWTGFATSTTLTVENGIVIKRAYKATTIKPSPSTVEEWIEDKTTLNTHTSGAATLTLDAIYQKAKNEWLNVDKKTNDIYFETNNSGMISSCGYVPHGCADDCFIGITITEIKML